MEGLLKKMGSAAIKASLKALASICSGVLVVIEIASRTEGKGGK